MPEPGLRPAILTEMLERAPAAIDLLVVAPIPDFDRASGSLRFYQILKILARRYRVMLLGWADPGDSRSPRYVEALTDAGVAVQVVPRADVVDGVSAMLGQVRLCVLFEFFTSAEWVLGRVRVLRPDLPVVIDSVDVHFLRELRGVPYAARPRPAARKARRTMRRELGVYRGADLVLAVTDSDRIQILRKLPKARVFIVPNIHQVREDVPGFEERRRNSLLFVGGFAHPPNGDAVLFFCRDILPRVKRALGQVEVTIIGDRPPPEILDLAGNGVVVAGWVPEVMPYLDSHCVAIAPLRYGAGMKGKVGQALAAGLPVVTTRVGAEGMELENGKTALIADSPVEFAEAVTRLCTDRRLHRDLSEAGRSHVRRRWDAAAVEGRLIEAVENTRRLSPAPLRASGWIAAQARDAYVRSGLGQRVERAAAVTAWYASRLSRRRR